MTGDDALVGRVLDGRYLVSSRIARGGMASVFLATDQRLDREVALKVMHSDLGEDGDPANFTNRFEREARAAAKLNHRNVVSVFDQGHDGDLTYLVMEYVPGRTLRDVMREEAPMPALRTMQLSEQILIALSAAHAAKIIHRDVKPENVLITPDGDVKVADFGLARAVSAATTATGGTLIGTVSYLAPEIVLHDGADARSDVYAVGAMMYEMLTGVKPHVGDTPIQVAYKHVHEDIAAPSAIRDGLPDYVDALIARATVRDRDQRSTDARVLLQQVRSVRRALEAGVVTDPDLVSDLQPRPRPIADPADPESPSDLTEETVAVAVGAAALGGGPAVDDTVGGTAQDNSPTAAVDRAGDRHEPTVAWTTQIKDPNRAAVDSAGNVVPPPPVSGTATGLHPPMAPEDYRAMRADENSNRRGKLMLVAAVLAALLVGGLGWWFADGRYADAPGLVGSTEEKAQEQAEAAGYTFEVEERRFSETVEAGVVISTDPGPGEKILPGETIQAVVSKGKDRVQLPENLQGMTVDEATAALGEVDLVVGETVEEFHEEIEKGRVIGATSIKAEDQLKRGTTVDLTISKGREPIPVESYVGKAYSEAKAALEEAGLTVQATEQFSDDVAAGIVISQDPAEGELFKGDTVNFVVSKGPDVVTVPNVVDMKRNDAAKALQDAGLEVEAFGPGNFDVQGQTPGAGEEVKRGSTVRIIGF